MIEKDSKNKPILVKFTNSNSRRNLYKSKKGLKDSVTKYYINEDLTKERATLLRKARQLMKIFSFGKSGHSIHKSITQSRKMM